jgi:serine kinase of HPr protein (carbohydrate metabolism regulator)
VTERTNVHATGLVLGRTGVMLRGPSGAGKSFLALMLLDRWEARGEGARLVADDRLDLEATAKGIVMHAPAAIAGLVELRGRGIVTRPHVGKAPLHLVVDLVPRLERMVEEEDLMVELMGVPVPRCPVPKAGVTVPEHQLLLVLEAIRALPSSRTAARQKIT